MLLFPSKFRKIQPQALQLGIPFFVCLFNCIKKPFWDVLAVAWSAGGSSPVLPHNQGSCRSLRYSHVRRKRVEAAAEWVRLIAELPQQNVLCAEVASIVFLSGTEGFE